MYPINAYVRSLSSGLSARKPLLAEVLGFRKLFGHSDRKGCLADVLRFGKLFELSNRTGFLAEVFGFTNVFELNLWFQKAFWGF